MDFFDDSLPVRQVVLTLERDTTGPWVGGNVIRVSLSNFPYEDIHVYYMVEDERIYIDQVSVQPGSGTDQYY